MSSTHVSRLKPRLYNVLRYVIVYSLFIVYAIAGLFITMNLRTNVLSVATMLQLHPQITFVLYSWGSYLVFIPYVILVGYMEPYLNQAVKKNLIMHRARKLFFILAGVGIVTVIINALAAL